MKLVHCLFLGSLLSASCFACAMAAPTEIIVRVIAKDAKFIGTGMGGVQVTLRDADSGEVLAQGLTAGGTGSTPRIMTEPHGPRDVLSDADAAKFSAIIDIDRPRRITVTATGPFNPEEAAVTVSSTQWVLPGKDINQGDAWLLEMRGFAVSLLEPPPSELSLNGASQSIPLKAKVTLMCGCPTTPGGMWDANKIEVAAIVTKGGSAAPPVMLSYAGEASTFGGQIEIAAPGDYVVDVYAYDPANGNTGLSRFNLHAQ